MLRTPVFGQTRTVIPRLITRFDSASRIPKVPRTFATRTFGSSRRSFATTPQDSNEEVEYEIDVISMTKTPKLKPKRSQPPAKPVRNLTHELINFKLVNSNHIDKVIIENSISKINENFDKNITNFVMKNSLELKEFLKFIQTSYDFKIKSFSQLTTIELLNCLYIFKDYYLKNKIPSINKYNFVNYNLMFSDCLKLLKKFPDFPQVLNEVYLINNFGLDLLSSGIGNYTEELKSLTQEFSFKDLSLDQICSAIDRIIHDFNNLVPHEYDEDFFRFLIQINRYKNLKSILSSVSGMLPVDLLALFNSENFQSIIRSVNKSTKESSDTHTLTRGELYLLKYVLENDELTVLQIITKLHHQNEATVKDIYEHLITLASNGILDIYDKPLLSQELSLTKFKISNDDMKQNFEFSLIYKYKLYNYIDELKVLLAMGIDLTNDSCLSAFKELQFTNEMLVDKFNGLFEELSSFFHTIPWTQTSSLVKLISNKNWHEWCQEIADSKISNLMFLDYSNLSDYSYKSIEVSTELAHILPKLSQFSKDNNNINLSMISLENLVTLFHNDECLRKVYLSHGGGVYLHNIQDLINDFNVLYCNLVNYDLCGIKQAEGNIPFSEFDQFRLIKHFGYYLELISNPLILDNLLVLYSSSKVKSDIVSKMIEELPKYSYELEIFKIDELKKNYVDVDFKEMLFILDKRIKEVLSNLNSNPSSRINGGNVERFLLLQRILSDIYHHDGHSANTSGIEEPQFNLSQLDKLITYTQIPDQFNISEYSNDLEYLRQHLNKPFANCSIDEILMKLEELVDESSGKLVLDKNLIKLSLKLQHLFRINGGDTGILDTVVHNQQQFDNFESKLKSDSPYYQIPDGLGIHSYIKELTELRQDVLGDEFKHFSSDEVLTLLDNFVATNGNHAHIYCFIELYHKLKTLFLINNGNTEVLDTVLHSQCEFERFESKLATHQEESTQEAIDTREAMEEKKNYSKQLVDELQGKFKYKQIPDFLSIHEFSEELKVLLQDELKGENFEMFADFEILDLLRYRISEILNGSSSSSSSRMNDKTIDRFLKLNNQLTELFRINGHNTQVLDSVLNSQEVFERFEQTKKQGSSPYRQLPDDFRLQEFLPEITQLKLQLDGKDFRLVSNNEILDVLSKMSANERKFNMSKRANFRKLHKNLTTLFKYNGNETSVLDNILINQEALENMNSASRNDRTGVQGMFGVTQSQLKEFFSITGWNDYDLVNFADVNEQEVYEKLDQLLEHIKKVNKYQYPASVELASVIKKYSGIDLVVNLAVLNELSKLHETVFSKKQIENRAREIKEFMAQLSKNRDLYAKENEQVEYKEQIEVPIQKFSMEEFTRGANQSDKQDPVKYNDPLKVENQNITRKDGEENMDDVELFVRNQIFHNLDQSFDNPKSSKEMEELLKLTPEKIRETYKTTTSSKSDKKPQNELDIQHYLENVKKQKTLKDEEAFRQRKAYEWSKIKSNSNRSLESKNFFDPLPNPSDLVGAKYLLLTLDGEKIISKQNPLGKNTPFEDIVDVLNKFNEVELNKFIKDINKLQTRDWKLIGGNSSNFGKYLVFIKVNDQESGLFKKLKSVLAMTGAIFMVLIGLNYWLEDPVQQLEAKPEPKESTTEPTMEIEPTESDSGSDLSSEAVDATEVKDSRAGWFWK